MLKRNHDTLLEKYELFRQRNQSLEKLAVEKEQMFNEIKIEQDKLSQKLFRLQKSHDEVVNSKELFEIKVKKLEENIKTKDEQIKTLKVQKEKFEGQCKVYSEQLELIQQANEELTSKKTSEVDLLSREIT